MDVKDLLNERDLAQLNSLKQLVAWHRDQRDVHMAEGGGSGVDGLGYHTYTYQRQRDADVEIVATMKGDERPITGTGKTFQELLEEKLQSSEMSYGEHGPRNSTKQIDKKPFLKMGSGMMKYTPVNVCNNSIVDTAERCEDEIATSLLRTDVIRRKIGRGDRSFSASSIESSPHQSTYLTPPLTPEAIHREVLAESQLESDIIKLRDNGQLPWDEHMADGDGGRCNNCKRMR